MASTTKHMRRTDVVSVTPESQRQFTSIFRVVVRANETSLDQEDALVLIALPENEIPGREVSTTPQFENGLSCRSVQAFEKMRRSRRVLGRLGEQSGAVQRR